MSAMLHRGETSKRNYTPVADVSAGDVITIGGLQYVAHRDIPANELGSLGSPYGGAAYRVDLDAGQTITDGQAVLVNTGTGIIDGTGAHFGYAEGDFNGPGGDTYAIVRHQGIVS